MHQNLKYTIMILTDNIFQTKLSCTCTAIITIWCLVHVWSVTQRKKFTIEQQIENCQNKKDLSNKCTSITNGNLDLITLGHYKSTRRNCIIID